MKLNIKTPIPFVLIVSMLITMVSCNENDPVISNENEDFAFELLLLEKDTILRGETANIEAVATGSNLIYNWSASVGDILGSGSKVIYGATPCAVGDILIKCEVSDASNNSDKKTVKIFIKE